MANEFPLGLLGFSENWVAAPRITGLDAPSAWPGIVTEATTEFQLDRFTSARGAATSGQLTVSLRREVNRDWIKDDSVVSSTLIPGWAQTGIVYLYPEMVRVWPDPTLIQAKKKFARLKGEWIIGVGPTSSTTDMILHPAYQRIIGMGPAVLPLLLRDLEAGPIDWFWALESITEENPVHPDDLGNIQAMAKAWIEWGRSKGYL